MGIGDFANKAKEFADQHDEQVDQGLDRAGDMANERFAGHEGQIDSVVDRAQQYTGDGDTTAPRAATPRRRCRAARRTRCRPVRARCRRSSDPPFLTTPPGRRGPCRGAPAVRFGGGACGGTPGHEHRRRQCRRPRRRRDPQAVRRNVPAWSPATRSRRTRARRRRSRRTAGSRASADGASGADGEAGGRRPTPVLGRRRRRCTPMQHVPAVRPVRPTTAAGRPGRRGVRRRHAARRDDHRAAGRDGRAAGRAARAAGPAAGRRAGRVRAAGRRQPRRGRLTARSAVRRCSAPTSGRRRRLSRRSARRISTSATVVSGSSCSTAIGPGRPRAPHVARQVVDDHAVVRRQPQQRRGPPVHLGIGLCGPDRPAEHQHVEQRRHGLGHRVGVGDQRGRAGPRRGPAAAGRACRRRRSAPRRSP